MQTIRFGAAAGALPRAGDMVSSRGRASETPVAFRKVRRLSGWCIDFVLSGKPDTHSIEAAYLFLNNLL